ncbi:MAG TPA: hypothetical protein VM936_12475 [Pyrinomonadaceae bacterium]|jgi:hypothetical protein|nr:hypothetical protein [Pyrinomonadaceae bacterium]
MSSEANEMSRLAGSTAKQAPTEQQESRPGVPRRFAPGQTVCNEKNEKGKLCNGHLKELNTQHPSRVHLRGDDTLYRCQACGALYMGPPMGHVRDPRKQARYVERDLAAILQAAGGTLPAYEYPAPAWRGEPKPKRVAQVSAKPAAEPKPAPKASAAVPADSSASADAHRPAAEAQAATGQASAAPLSPTAATASPAAGAETAADLATEASTELTPGAPKDERAASAPSQEQAPAADAKPKAKKGAHSGFKVAPEFREQEGETQEQKIARLKRLVEEAKRAAGKI